MNSARLKRKLGDLGVDTSSRKANENFCLVDFPILPVRAPLTGLQIGTPLPPLEKSRDTGEFVPLWKQEVSCCSLVGYSSDVFLLRSETRRAEEDYTAPSLVVSLPATSTLSVQRKVSPVVSVYASSV